jgi:hypothetical protein
VTETVKLKKYCIKQMEHDNVLKVLKRTINNEKLWACTHIDTRIKYVALHSFVTILHLDTVIKFLIALNWRPKLVNNDSTQYRADQYVGFFLFETDEADSDRQ